MGGIIGPLGWIGMYSILIIVFYFIAIRVVFQYEKRHILLYVKEKAEELRYREVSTSKAVKYYIINAVIVIVAAFFLPQIGEGLAEITGLGKTFVGNVLIAFATSLPEVVVSLSALKIDAVDLAIGNLFGSNIFNIFILAIDDIFFLKGPILAHVDIGHVISAISAVSMTAIAIIGLTYRASKKRLFIAWDSLCIVVVYIVNIMSLYMLR